MYTHANKALHIFKRYILIDHHPPWGSTFTILFTGHDKPAF